MQSKRGKYSFWPDAARLGGWCLFLALCLAPAVLVCALALGGAGAARAAASTHAPESTAPGASFFPDASAWEPSPQAGPDPESLEPEVLKRTYVIRLKEGFSPYLPLLGPMRLSYAVYMADGIIPAPDGLEVRLMARTAGGKDEALWQEVASGQVLDGRAELLFTGDMQRRVRLKAVIGRNESERSPEIVVGGLSALESGFIVGPGASHGWSFIGNNLTWEEAVDFCAAQGGTLPDLEYYPVSEGVPDGYYWSGRENDPDTAHTLMGSLHGLGLHSGVSPKVTRHPTVCRP